MGEVAAGQHVLRLDPCHGAQSGVDGQRVQSVAGAVFVDKEDESLLGRLGRLRPRRETGEQKQNGQGKYGGFSESGHEKVAPFVYRNGSIIPQERARVNDFASALPWESSPHGLNQREGFIYEID